MSTLTEDMRTNLGRLTEADLPVIDRRLADPNDPVLTEKVAWLPPPHDPFGGDWEWLVSATETLSPDPSENGGGR